MTCPNCGSSNVTVQAVTDAQLKTQHHGCLWWLLVSWWWLPIKWILFTIPALIFAIFVPRRQKLVTTHTTMCVCQECGHSW